MTRDTMDGFQTGLFDCFKSTHTTAHGHIVDTSRWVTAKALFCPCILLGENTQRLDLEPGQVYCQQWNAVGYVAFAALSGALATTTSPVLDSCTLGAAALHASERDALMREFDITTEQSSAETFLKATFCACCALAQESREITIRQHLGSSGLIYEAPEPEEMNKVFR
jgi:Cys-rich protein (TIGR01571 family)